MCYTLALRVTCFRPTKTIYWPVLCPYIRLYINLGCVYTGEKSSKVSTIFYDLSYCYVSQLWKVN